ncbi:Hypothetical predicted protein [Pelobates cultripes]|uniref:GIY-YIG domain-containing protein n=1 Tax=Pelobates cultripes TaxID=61616 RepID=A0AAD1SRY6_PELCU|nr:Hypothetical predicted protein [Pelobates cultripes]
MTTTYYLQEAAHILGDRKTYSVLKYDPTSQFNTELQVILNGAKERNIISQRNYEFLYQKNPTIPIFYFLPKTHKRLPNPPGRPIISGINSLTANLSAYVDSRLQKYARGAPSYVKDTKSFLQEMENIEWDQEYSWATLDVTSLYTVISHRLGLEAVDYFMEQDVELPEDMRDFIFSSDYVNFLNDNEYNLVFTPIWNKDEINFLDLCLSHDSSHIKSKCFFKPTDGNGFVHRRSGHYEPWLRGIAKSQFTRLRRNCSDKQDFFAQSLHVKRKLTDRGYNGKRLEREIRRIGDIERKTFLENKSYTSGTGDSFRSAFTTHYNIDYNKIKRSLQSSWPILLQDPILGTHLPDNPLVIYKRNKNLKDMLAPSYAIKPPSGPTSASSGSFRGCGTCKACTTVSIKNTHSFFSSTTGESFTLRDSINCHTDFVVYLLQCPCGMQYVGRTKRILKVRLLEHLNNIRKRLTTHSVPTHCISCPLFSFKDFRCWGIERVHPFWRGGNRVQRLAQRETFWIHKLQTLSPKGLNIDIDLICFLD